MEYRSVNWVNWGPDCGHRLWCQVPHLTTDIRCFDIFRMLLYATAVEEETDCEIDSLVEVFDSNGKDSNHIIAGENDMVAHVKEDPNMDALSNAVRTILNIVACKL